MFWKTKKFKELKSEWNEKLKESGFNDIEKEVDGQSVLKTLSVGQYVGNRGFPGAYRFKNEEEIKDKLSYFTLLYQCIQAENNFEDELDKLIMERTAEGKTIKEISTELRSMLQDGKQRSKHNRDTIRYVRRRYEHKWGIKLWKPEQMVSRKPIR